MALILVVDDRPPNRDFLVSLLGYRGYRLLEASGGAEALALTRAERPDLIIADVLMPGIDGYEFVRQLRADPAIAQTPVVFYTAAYHEREARALAHAAGVLHVITKPIEPEVVLDVVESVLAASPPPAPAPLPEAFEREHLHLLTDTLLQKVSQLESANRRLTGLIELGQSLASEHDPLRLLQQVCEAARTMIGARYAACVLLADGQSPSHYLTSGMPADAAARLAASPPGCGLLARLLAAGQPLRVTDVSAQRDSGALPPGHPPVQTVLGVPLASPTHCYGALYLADKLDAAEFSLEDEQIVVTLATQAALAYENARRYDQILRQTAALQKAEQTQRFLAEAGTLLASSLDYRTTLQNVAHLAVPRLADLCLVHVLDEQGIIEPVASAPVNTAGAAMVDELQYRYPPHWANLHPLLAVLETAQPEIAPDVSDALLENAAGDAEELELLRELRLKSYMIVPLIAGGRTLGAISFLSAESGRCYGPDDLALAEELARRASLAVDNARLFREAQQAIQIRDEFLSVASHEIRTPLVSLRGYAELLQRQARRETSSDPRDLQAVSVIHEQAVRLHKLIGSLFDFSRIQTGQLSVNRSPVDLASLARRIVAILQPTVERHMLQFECSDAPLLVEGDELRLEQVLQNLIDNAIKYSPEGGMVAVRLEARGERVVLTVSDQGIGIPGKDLPQLFNRFYRASNVNPHRTSGLGIGLYMAQEIVTLHDGTIEVESTEGQGCTFTVSLPLLPQ